MHSHAATGQGTMTIMNNCQLTAEIAVLKYQTCYPTWQNQTVS